MATVYKVTTGVISVKVGKPKKGVEQETVERKVVRWASAAGAATKARMELMAEHSLKRDSIEIAQVDVPTSKGGIIDWLNENHTTE